MDRKDVKKMLRGIGPRSRRRDGVKSKAIPKGKNPKNNGAKPKYRFPRRNKTRLAGKLRQLARTALLADARKEAARLCGLAFAAGIDGLPTPPLPVDRHVRSFMRTAA